MIWNNEKKKKKKEKEKEKDHATSATWNNDVRNRPAGQAHGHGKIEGEVCLPAVSLLAPRVLFPQPSTFAEPQVP